MAGAIILIIIGLTFGILGSLTAFGQKSGLLHRYHHEKVAPADKKRYCFLSGLGIIFIGLGILLSGVLIWITGSEKSMIAMANGFIAGLVMLAAAGIGYIR